MNIKTLSIHIALLAFGITLLGTPKNSGAYFDPYDVLLKDLQLPASSRYAEAHINRQQLESEERRNREQEQIFAEQAPPVNNFIIAEEADTRFASAPEISNEGVLPQDAANISPETLGILRMIERIEKNRETSKLQQQAISLLSAEGITLHSGAPLQGSVIGKGGVIGKGYIDGGYGGGMQGVLLPDGNFLPAPVPGLAPTGMGSAIAFLLLIGAIGFILHRVKKSEAQTRAMWETQLASSF